MVITHKKSTHLEDAYYNIIWRLNNAGIKYETENNIVPRYDPNARDEYGNPYPEPDPDTVGTGTAWIKIFFEDRKQVFVYFCCHLVECKTCTYDRFITVYNYTDDVKDTNLQGMLPVLTLKYYADREESDGDRIVYFNEITLEDLGITELKFKKPIVTNQVETVCETCEGKGTVESETTVPSGNPYKPPVKIKINTTCPDCHGTGKNITESPDNYCTIEKFKVYGFYVKKSQEEGDIIDNRINDGNRPGLPDDDPSNLGEDGLIRYAKRLYTNKNSYDPTDVPEEALSELSKVTTYNTQLYLDENGNPLSTVEEIYDLIAKTNVNNNNLTANGEEEVDLSKYLFAIPIFKEFIDLTAEEPKTDYKIVDFRFYQTNYVDQHGKLIPINAYCCFSTQRVTSGPDIELLTNGYNPLGVSDITRLPQIGSTYQQYNPTTETGVWYYQGYDTCLVYESGGIRNFTKHCGEVEVVDSSSSKQKRLINPTICTYTDISQTDKVWNFICYKDKNLPIVPFDADTLYIAQTTWPYKVDLYKDEHVTFKNILSQKSAAYIEPLDAPVLTPKDSPDSTEDPDFLNFVYPIDTFKGVVNLTTFKDIHVIPGSTYTPWEKALYLEAVSNNNTVICDKGISKTYPDNIAGIVFNNNTFRIAMGVKMHLKLHESYKDAVPVGTSQIPICNLYIGVQDFDPETGIHIGEIKPVNTLQIKAKNIKPYYDPEDPTTLCYEWPMSIETYNVFYIDSDYYSNTLEFPFKHKRFVFRFDYIDEEHESDPAISKNPYNYDDVEFSLEVSLTTNMPKYTFSQFGLAYEGVENIALLPKIKYNYNDYPEGVFNYYHTNYGTYIQNYIFNKYSGNMMQSVLNTDEEKIRLIPDTIESQQEYHGFMNVLFEKRLQSIYTKMDSRDDFITCPACKGDTSVDCVLCGNKRKLSMYDYNNYKVRYACPAMESNSDSALDYMDHEHGISSHYRCRACAGTKSVVRYYYLKAFEFKDLSYYNGKMPVPVDLNDLSDIISRVLGATVTEHGSQLSEPYLNYIVRKHYDIIIGQNLDFGNYYSLYNAAVNNLVFYKINGKFIKYLYWNGYKHIEVDYGYNYIYSTKTFNSSDWVPETNKDNKVLYRIITEEKDVDEMVGFYRIIVPEVNYNYDDFDTTRGVRVQRIYFDKSWVYSNLLNDLTFKHFNLFTEKERQIITTKDAFDDAFHVHNEDDQIVEKRCPTCGGTGMVEDQTCTTCNGTGAYPDDLPNIKLVTQKSVFTYTSMPYINTKNISFEVYDQESPVIDGETIEEIIFEE